MIQSQICHILLKSISNKRTFFWRCSSITQTQVWSFTRKKCLLFCTFSRIPAQASRNDKKKSGQKVGCRCFLSWLFCFVVDPVAWVCIHGQFLRALPVKAGMCVGPAHTYRQHCPFNVIIADPHRLLSPGLTWTSASSEEGNVCYPQAGVTPLHSADPKKSQKTKKQNAPTSPCFLPTRHRRVRRGNRIVAST